MKIEVLGTGCAKCNKLEAMTRAAADKLGIPYEIEHISDISAMRCGADVLVEVRHRLT